MQKNLEIHRPSSNKWRCDRKINGFDCPKPLKRIEKQTFIDFWSFPKTMKQGCQREPQKSCFGFKMETWGSQVRLILWLWIFWCDAKKSSFCDALPMDQQIKQIRPWGAKGSPRGHRLFANAKFPGGMGPRDQLEVGPLDHWTIHKGSRHAVGPKDRRIYKYIKVQKDMNISSVLQFCLACFGDALAMF